MWNFFATLTLLLSQAHNSHDVVRRVKEREHGQVCKPVGQLVQEQQTEQTHVVAQREGRKILYAYLYVQFVNKWTLRLLTSEGTLKYRLKKKKKKRRKKKSLVPVKTLRASSFAFSQTELCECVNTQAVAWSSSVMLWQSGLRYQRSRHRSVIPSAALVIDA